MKEREIKAENDREISISKALSASNECIHPKLILQHKGWKDFFFFLKKKKYFYDRVMNQNKGYFPSVIKTNAKLGFKKK